MPQTENPTDKQPPLQGVSSASEQRRKLHRALLNYAIRACKDGSCKGLHRFLDQIMEPNTQRQVLLWLELYTPIRYHRDAEGGIRQFYAPKPDGPFDLSGARLNEYWAVELPKSSQHLQPARIQEPKRQAGTNGDTRQFTGHGYSDKQFNQKRVMEATKAFLDDPTIDAKRHLMTAIEDYYARPASRRGGAGWTVSGGLPSLGKNAR